MKRVLVTAIGGQVGHGILKSLDGYDGEMFGTDIDDYPAGMDRVRSFFKIPLAMDAGFIPALIRICEDNAISHLIPVNEQEIVTVAENVDQFISKDIRVLSLNLEQLKTCSDKYTLPKTLTAFGLYAPESFTVDEFVPDGRQYIAKIRNSYGSRLTQIFETREQLMSTVARAAKEVVVQRYIPSPKTEYTIGVFATEREVRSIAFRRELEGGYTQLIELVTGLDAEFRRIAECVAKNLKIVGCFNIQLRENEGKYYIFEINPRISGTVYFRHQLGFQDVRWWLAHSSGESVLPYENKYTKAVGIREFNEKIIISESPNVLF